MPISPSFPFFPSDFLGDPHTIVMDTTEIGAYCLLMWVCWEQDGLPADVAELADYARMPVKKFEILWHRKLKRCFVFDTKRQQYIHPRFEKIIRGIKEFRKQKSKAGKASGEKRRRIKDLTDEQVLDSVGTEHEQEANKNEPSYSSSIPSSSSSFKPSEREAREEEKTKKPSSLPNSVETEINVWLDSIAPLTGARDRRTLANPKRWRDVVEKAMKEGHDLRDFMAVVQKEAERNKATPQFFTPEQSLKTLQLGQIKANNGFIH